MMPSTTTNIDGCVFSSKSFGNVASSYSSFELTDEKSIKRKKLNRNFFQSRKNRPLGFPSKAAFLLVVSFFPSGSLFASFSSFLTTVDKSCLMTHLYLRLLCFEIAFLSLQWSFEIETPFWEKAAAAVALRKLWPSWTCSVRPFY